MKKLAIKFFLEKSKGTLLITLLITAFLASGAQFIFMDDDIMNMLPKETPSRKIWDSIVDEFKYSDFLFIAFGNKNKNVLTNENISLMWDLSEKLNDVPEVDEIITLTTMQRINGDKGFLEISDLIPKKNLNQNDFKSLSKYINENSIIKSRLLSKNNDFINIIIRPKINTNFPKLVLNIQNITKPYEQEFEFHYGGQPYIAGKVPDLIKKETLKLMSIGLFIMSIVLLINLRSISSVLMILMLIFMSMISMIGFFGWIYYFTGSSRFFFSFLNSSMPIVLLTIANSDGVHVLSRFFKEARKHKNTNKAISLTMEQLNLPIFLTSITTGAAFISMVTSPIPSMTGYGISIAFGIIWAWILSCTLLPALINLKKWDFSKKSLSQPSILENIIKKFGNNMLRHPKKVLGIGLSIIAFSSFGIQYVNVEVNLINLFKSGNTIKKSTHFLDEEMAGSMNLMIKINEDMKDPNILNQMVTIQNFLQTLPFVNTTFSIADIIKEMHAKVMDDNEKFHTIPNNRKKINNLFTMYSMSGDLDDFESLINHDYDVGLITTMMHTVSTNDVVKLSNKIDSFLNVNTPDLNVEISGLMMFLKDFVSIVVKSSIQSILFSIIIILFIIWIFFRSLKFGLLSIIPLTCSIIVNFGLMGWFGIDLSHFTALLTSIIIGVGVDFSIHYISDFKYCMKNNIHTNNISMEVMKNVGYPILLDVFSNMGFIALIFSSLIPLIQMGGLMVFAMISTSIGTLTILASIMEINKKNIVNHVL